MLAVPGLDAMVIGPRDLSLAMGHAEGPSHPAVQALIDTVLRRCTGAGIAGGITAATHADCLREERRGARLLMVTLPSLLLAGAGSFLAEDAALR
ncbi:MAG: aldolase/citrate lyase family protein [Gammaproteobacteria bacterium]